jgi:hypothetical protein
MRRWITGAAIVLGLGLALPARAATQANPFEKLVVLHPAYQSVRQLETRGYPSGAPEATFSGRRELTRYEFALAVERIYRSLQPRILGAAEPGTLREDLSAFQQLLKEFEPELSAIGQDLQELKRQVESMSERLARLEGEARRAASPARGLGSEDVLAAALSRSRYRGLRENLRAPYREDILGRADLTRSPVGTRRPTFLATSGPFSAGFQIQRPDTLTTLDRLPLEDPSAGMSYAAQFSAAFGSYLLTAFYNREGGLADRFGLWNPYFPTGGGIEAFGGSLTGELSDRLALQLETATLSSLSDDPTRMLYVRGGINYTHKRLAILLGYELLKRGGLDGAGGSAYFLGIGHSIGSVQLDVLLRHYNQSRGGGSLGGDPGSSSAITQISVRF